MPSEASLATLRLSDVRRRFDKAATLFDEADFVHSVTRNGLLARLEPILIEARTIVDLGCATGSACRRLGKQFRRSHVIGVDLALGMLQQMKRKQSWSAKPSPVQANATALPFADQSIDVIFANLLLPWIDDPARVFKEIARVLRKDGLLLFSTLGPDSLQELRQAWQSVDIAAHVNRFLDMHDIGDAVVGAGLRDPVLDVDRLEVTYSDTDTLFRDLTATGGRNSLQRRNRSLIGKNRFKAMTRALASAGRGDSIRMELELVYGHCWGSGSRTSGAEYRIDPAQIVRRR